MNLWKPRRIVSLLVALAFIAGMQLAAAPMSAAEVIATKIVGQSNSSGCKVCGDQNMAAAQCSAMCAALQSFHGHVAAFLPVPSMQSWPWLSESVPAVATQPDLAPPRS